MKGTLIILVFIVAICDRINSQTYINLNNNTGDNINDHISDLTHAADELVANLPIIFRDSFKVFTFGAYLHLERYETSDSIVSICSNYARQNSKYYLLITRMSSDKGLNKNVFCELKLPTSDSMHCVLNEHFDLIASEIEQVIMNKYIKLKSDPYSYHIAEIEGINYLSYYIKDKVICCDGTGRSQSCEPCYSEAALELYLKNREFDLFYIPSLTYTPFENVTNNIIEYAELTTNATEELFNINNDVIGVFNELVLAGIDAKVTIDFYSYLGCNRIVNQIGQKPKSGVSNPYAYLDIIGYNSEEYGPALGVRLNTNLISNNTPGTSTFYLLNLDNNLDIDNIIEQFRYFLNKATLNQISIDKLYPLTPCLIGATDAVAILGRSKSKIFNLAISNESIKNNLKADEIEDLESWYIHPNELNIERTKSSVGLICTSTNDLNQGCNKWDDDNGVNNLVNNPNKYSRLLGFVLLHCTAHNSGIEHSDLGENGKPLKQKWQTEDYGYAAPGYEITQMIKYYPVHRTFEMIIDETVNEPTNVVQKTKRRFGIE